MVFRGADALPFSLCLPEGGSVAVAHTVAGPVAGAAAALFAVSDLDLGLLPPLRFYRAPS